MEIKEVIRMAGGPVKLGRLLKRSKGAVSQWRVVPHDHVIAVCEAAGWKVRPHDLRPDLYPNPTDAMPGSICKCEQAA